MNWQQGATNPVRRYAWIAALSGAERWRTRTCWRPGRLGGTFGDGGRYIARGRLMYFDHGAVEGYSVIQAGGAERLRQLDHDQCGDLPQCAGRPGLRPTYNIVEGFRRGQRSTTPGDRAAGRRSPTTRPARVITVHLDQHVGHIPNRHRLLGGLHLRQGRQTRHRELGYQCSRRWRRTRYGLWYDLTSPGRPTATAGVPFAYAFAKNWRLNANPTYLNKLDVNDVGAADGSARNVFDRGLHKRLQLDLNMAIPSTGVRRQWVILASGWGAGGLGPASTPRPQSRCRRRGGAGFGGIRLNPCAAGSGRHGTRS